MNAQGFGATALGKKRHSNEDSMLVDNDRQLFIVSDGMGGHAAGELASSAAVEAVSSFVNRNAERLNRLKSENSDIPAMVAFAKESVERACEVVYELSLTSPEKVGMGCTLTMLIGVGSKIVMAHVGDSRMYLARDGEVHLMSHDHTMVAELLRAGALSPEQAKSHPYGSVLTRAIGPQSSVQVDTLVIETRHGDRFMICSDGLSEYIPDTQWLAERMFAEDPDILADQFASFADDSGGKDNITVVVVAIEEDAAPSHADVGIRALASISLFEHLTLAQMSCVTNISTVRTHQPGDVLVRQGENIESLVVVLEGELSASQGEKVIPIVKHQFFGTTSLFEPRRAHATVKAETATTTLEILYDDFSKLSLSRPWLGVHLLRRLGQHACRVASIV